MYLNFAKSWLTNTLISHGALRTSRPTTFANLWMANTKSASGKESCELADRRNALAHEGMYGGQPLGFAHPPDQGAVELGLKALVSRILLSALGMRNKYTLSASTCGQFLSFEVPA